MPVYEFIAPGVVAYPFFLGAAGRPRRLFGLFD